jgi:hypothetical protein
MTATAGVATLSIRAPLQLRYLIAEACAQTEISRAEYVASAAVAFAKGIAEGKAPAPIPEWFDVDERDRRMMTITLYPEDLELTKEIALKRLMIPHTRFVLWAVTLMALNDLGKTKAKKIVHAAAADLEGLEAKAAN